MPPGELFAGTVGETSLAADIEAYSVGGVE